MTEKPALIKASSSFLERGRCPDGGGNLTTGNFWFVDAVFTTSSIERPNGLGVDVCLDT